MRIISILLFLFSFVTEASNYTVDLFCQDLNVILTKRNVADSNIKNAKTTRTVKGGPYLKKVVTGCRNGKCKIEERKNDIVLKYEPNHPDANENGYVAYPDIDVSEEMEKMIKAAQAKTLILENLPEKSESLLVGKKFAECFKNYELVKHEIDYQTYLGR